MICISVLASALTWYPATNWVESADSVASPNARSGGIVRFCGAQAPKSYNGYIDNSQYSQMTFALMYECLLNTDPVTHDFVSGLARRWAMSEDGREFMFELDGRAK